jgi:hypothetical protein
MRYDAQPVKLLGHVSGQDETRRAAVQEDRLVRLQVPHGLSHNLILLQAMNGQPLLNGRFVEMAWGMGRLHAPQAFDQPASLQQLVRVATNCHLRHVQQPGELLVGTGPHGVEVVDDRVLALQLVHYTEDDEG